VRYDTVTFLSDYGRADEFVGVVHSVLRNFAPDARVIDLSHDIEPHDVRGAGLMLARAAPQLAPGVVLGVVDPGVGTDRRGVAIEIGDGSSVLVGPDNGLFAHVVAMCGGPDRVVSLTNEDFHLDSTSSTFDGRDVFAPVAAHLCQGVDLEEFGEVVDPGTMLPGTMPILTNEDHDLLAEVLWVDRFGNAQLNMASTDLDPTTDTFGLVIKGRTRTVGLAGTFGDVAPGKVGLITDAHGLLALVIQRGSAAEELELRTGSEVRISPLDKSTGSPVGPTKVTLGPSVNRPGGDR